MAVFTSYDTKGNKLSFANWISNLSPVDTFFVSVTGKEMIKNKKFQWQTDVLSDVDKGNAHKESDDAGEFTYKKTEEKENVTQILRKVVEVTDTADATDNYGRTKELQYQLEKAGKEIKRDLEAILLSDQAMKVGAANTGDARNTACFEALVSKDAIPGVAGSKKVYKDFSTNALKETDLFEMTTNLYLAGSEANTIMYHPEYATFFSSLMESGSGKVKVIENLDTKLNKFVGTLVDPLGQEYKLVPNRFMDPKKIYIFNPRDWDQMILRAPEKVKLAKTGSSEKYMIEMEVGLRHRNPFASAVLKVQ